MKFARGPIQVKSAVWSFLALSAGSTCAAGTQVATAKFVREIPWAAKGTWIAADTHIHTSFSDGNTPVSDLVAKAFEYGCQAVAITDHSDGNLKAATPEYAGAIIAARAANPRMPIIAGVEWNIPPWGGDEHATVLVPPGANEWTTLAEFKRRFDDYKRADHDTLDSLEALRWLAVHGPENGVNPVVVYNHPSRKDAKSMENVPDIERWRSANDLVIGFEGGPGHQGRPSPGEYLYLERTIDRWDPAVARVGDAWDTLLQRGVVAGGAIATSDFHGTNNGDYWPCQFSETFLHVPEISATGVLRALRAGALYGVHGHIVRNVSFTVDVPGLGRAALVGEAVEVPVGSSVTATVRLEVPAADWEGQPNRLDEVELIAVTKAGAKVIATTTPKAGVELLRQTVVVPAGGVVLRARGRRIVPEGHSLAFYTNPIWVGSRR